MSGTAFISSATIPFVIFFIIARALFKRVNVFDCFCDGAKDGLKTAISIITPIIALMSGISMLRASGAIEMLASIIRPLTNLIGLDENLLPLALLRPISGSGSIGIVSDIVSRFGPDSAIAKTACVMSGSTETTFYTLALYFGSIGIKKTRHTVAAALFADCVSVIVCLIVCTMFFGL